MKGKLFLGVSSLLILILWLYTSFKFSFKVNYYVKSKSSNYFINDYLIQPNITFDKRLTILIIVSSYVGHVELRSAHRRAMPIDLLNSLNIKRIFLLAQIPRNEKYINQAAITNENKIFGDILQGNFLENYRNLTHKHLMGLKWAATNCKEAHFLLKVDDDTVFSIHKTLELLQQHYTNLDSSNFLLGYMLNNTRPKRLKQNKWYVKWEEYSKSYYPPYLSGWYYITTPEVAKILTDEALKHQYFWIDDVYITGILAQASNIKIRNLSINYWWSYYELLECCLRDMIKKIVRCEAIGPNGGRNNLIVEFNRALDNCDMWKNCTIRPVSKPLNKVCVAFKERDIFSQGMAEIDVLKL